MLQQPLLLVPSVSQLARLGQPAFELVGQLPVVQQVLMLTQMSQWVALSPVVEVVADSSVEVPLPSLELAVKSWIYSYLPHGLQIFVLLMRKRDPSSSYLWMIYVHPLFVLIVIFSLLQKNPFFAVLIVIPFGTSTYDALSVGVFEIGILLRSVIYDHPPRCRKKKKNLDLESDFSVEYLGRSDVRAYDDEILVVLIGPAGHVVHCPVH